MIVGQHDPNGVVGHLPAADRQPGAHPGAAARPCHVGAIAAEFGGSLAHCGDADPSTEIGRQTRSVVVDLDGQPAVVADEVHPAMRGGRRAATVLFNAETTIRNAATSTAAGRLPGSRSLWSRSTVLTSTSSGRSAAA